MKVQIFGAGCPRCKQTEKIFKIAAEELGVEAEFEKVTDLMAMMEIYDGNGNCFYPCSWN